MPYSILHGLRDCSFTALPAVPESFSDLMTSLRFFKHVYATCEGVDVYQAKSGPRIQSFPAFSLQPALM
jgi:hypothetical protein